MVAHVVSAPGRAASAPENRVASVRTSGRRESATKTFATSSKTTVGGNGIDGVDGLGRRGRSRDETDEVVVMGGVGRVPVVGFRRVQLLDAAGRGWRVERDDQSAAVVRSDIHWQQLDLELRVGGESSK